MPKSGHYNKEREQYWRNIMTAWRQSGELKSHFCRSHEIKLSHFCTWEKKLRERGLKRKESGPATSAASAQRPSVRKLRTVSTDHPESTRSTACDAKSQFVEVNVTNEPTPTVSKPSCESMIELVLPNGVLLKLPAQIETRTLLAVVDAISK